MRVACSGEWTRSSALHHENEPMIKARDGALFQPFALVLVEITEHGTPAAPPGWQLFLMRDPARQSPDPAPPPVPCGVGEILPFSQEVRTLVAVEGSPGGAP